MLNGLVLAGGRSLRMGQDKGAMVWHGLPQTQYLAALLAPFVDEVFVSVRKDQAGMAHVSGLAMVEDHYPCPSPLNGIVSAMRMQPKTNWLVVAVDMPHVDRPAVEALLERRDASKVATCFESPGKGGPDPLLAVWEGHAFSLLEPMVQRTEHVCPRNVLKTMPVLVLKDAVAARVLDNINTPDDAAQVKVAS